MIKKSEKYKVVIIGSGPAGYQAAIRSGQIGFKTLVVEKGSLGGVCLNTGCVPTKGFSKISDFLFDIQQSSKYGVMIDNYNFDIAKAVDRNNSIISELQRGIAFLFKKNNVDYISGTAKIIDSHHVSIVGDDNIVVDTEFIIIASGARSRRLFPNSNPKILYHNDILSIKQIPATLSIIGAGAIGMEFASIFSTFGTKINLVEVMDNILPGFDSDIQNEIGRTFRKSKISIFTNAVIDSIDEIDDRMIISGDFGKVDSLKSDYILVAAGSLPYYDNLWDGSITIQRSEKGAIIVDDDYKTSISNIYAIGDVNAKMMTAYAAGKQGVDCVEGLAGIRKKISGNQINIPKIVYTHPAIGTIGYTESKCINDGIDYWTKKFYLRGLSLAKTDNRIEGFVKIIIDKSNDTLIGGHIVGEYAYELIHQFLPLMNNNISLEEFSSSVFAHPTISEGIKENIEDYFGKSIHSV